MDRFDMEIARNLIVCNEIVEEESFTYVGKELDVVIQNDVNVGIDVIEDLSIIVIADVELYVHSIMNDVDLDVACRKKMDLLASNMVEHFRGVIDMDLHDVVADMDLNLYVAAEMLKDIDVVTNVDFPYVVDLYVS